MKNISFLLLILCLSFSAAAQTPKWFQKVNQIKPLESSKADVERIFNDAKLYETFTDKGNEVSTYFTKNGNFSVIYSSEKCSSGWVEDYNVETGKVIKFDYFLRRHEKLSKFEIYTTGADVSTSGNGGYFYRNDQLGITYGIRREKLMSIEIFPSAKYDNLKCKNPN